MSDSAKVAAALAIGAALGAGGMKATAPLPPGVPLPSVCFSRMGPPVPCASGVSDDTDCTYQPPGLRPPPCLADGGFDESASDYLDAGCLARVCPRYAAIRESGRSQRFGAEP